MDVHLGLWSGGDSRLIPLDQQDVSIGLGEENDVTLAFDATVSRLHAVIVRVQRWLVAARCRVGEQNVPDGRRPLSEQALRPGDEIRVGPARVVFRSVPGPVSSETVQEGATCICSPVTLTEFLAARIAARKRNARGRMSAAWSIMTTSSCGAALAGMSNRMARAEGTQGPVTILTRARIAGQ
jgi:hypothetical protein